LQQAPEIFIIKPGFIFLFVASSHAKMIANTGLAVNTTSCNIFSVDTTLKSAIHHSGKRSVFITKMIVY